MAAAGWVASSFVRERGRVGIRSSQLDGVTSTPHLTLVQGERRKTTHIVDIKAPATTGLATRAYFVACCTALGSSSKIHSTTETGRLPFLIRSSWN